MPDRMFWKDKTVLVTGATGFLGGWLVRRLLDLECRVIAIVRDEKPLSQFYIGEFQLQTIVVRGSVCDLETFAETFRKNQVDVVFHTAALADINLVLENPVECFRSCIESTWWILDTCRTQNPECVVVVSSSDKAYGLQEVPIEESQLLNPIHPYDTAKATQDLIAQSYGKIYDMPVGVTRCGNFFGGYDFTFSRIIPGTIRDVLDGVSPTLRSDGHFTRDFLYIEDATDAQLLLAERLAIDSVVRGEPFNFSYGLQIEIVDIVGRILELMNSDLEPIIRNNVQVETRHLSLSSEKARNALDWTPACGFDEGLKRTINWYTRIHAAVGGVSNLANSKVLQTSDL